MRFSLLTTLLLVAVADAVVAETTGAHSSQSLNVAQKTQKAQVSQAVQGTQNAQLFGLPPLPLVLAAAGGLLARTNSPIRLNTKVVADKPTSTEQKSAPADPVLLQEEDQSAPPPSSTASAAAPGDAAQQKYMKYVVPQETASGPTMWVQAPGTSYGKDGVGVQVITSEPQITTDSAVTRVVTSMPVTSDDATDQTTVPSGQLVSGRIVTSVVKPSQDKNNDVVNITTPSSTDATASTTKTATGNTPAIIAVPISSQQVQQQVWVPMMQGRQVVQGYYPSSPMGAQVFVVPIGQVGAMQAGYQPSMGWGSMSKGVWGTVMQPQGAMDVAQGNMGMQGGMGKVQANMGMMPGGYGKVQGNVGMQGSIGQMQGNMGPGVMGTRKGPKRMAQGSMGAWQAGMGPGMVPGSAPSSPPASVSVAVGVGPADDNESMQMLSAQSSSGIDASSNSADVSSSLSMRVQQRQPPTMAVTEDPSPSMGTGKK